MAAESGADANPGVLANLMPMILVMTIFYVFVFLPQKRKLKEHQDMVRSLKVGDKVITSGGLVVSIKALGADEKSEFITAEYAPGQEVEIVRDMILRKKTAN